MDIFEIFNIISTQDGEEYEVNGIKRNINHVWALTLRRLKNIENVVCYDNIHKIIKYCSPADNITRWGLCRLKPEDFEC